MERSLSRALPNRRLRWLILAIACHMGDHGLRMMLRQAGMDRYLDRPPPADDLPETSSAEYSQLLTIVRTYFGLGARGTLTRIGREVFLQRLASGRSLRLARPTVLAVKSKVGRMRWTLERLARGMAAPEGSVSVRESGGNLWLADRTGDRTVGVVSEDPLCWSAVGEISQALFWATGDEGSVREVDCRAAGDESCRFAIL